MRRARVFGVMRAGMSVSESRSAAEDGDLSVIWHDIGRTDRIHPDQVERITDEEKAAYIAAWPSEERA
ncbi:hypothetical protein AB0F17_07215 [Nonomuraea sp. NPDC026600]|uniref:hypothetical protein n=1 Tax=Nonomuraea sp. NPDC026600 TaxID=3155363 RepID=UPI0033E2C575